MTYTVTCPDPDCRTTFTVEESDLALDSEDSEPIVCPECETPWAWDFDEDATPPLKLTEPDEEEDEDEEESEDDGFEDAEDEEEEL